MSDEPPDPSSDGTSSVDSGSDDASEGYSSDPGVGESDSDGAGPDEPRESITEGSLIRPLFQLAWPIIVIQLLQVAYNVVDTLYLGRLSADAVGAISLAFPLIFLLVSVAAGFTTAGAILVAQYTGAKGDRSAGLVAGQTVTFVSLLSLVVAVVGFFFARPALELLPTQADTGARVIPLAADYMEVFFVGIPFLFGFFVFSALLRGYGDTRTPMYVMVLSVVANILLDPFLIFGFQSNPLLGAVGLDGVEASLLAATGFTGYGIEGAAVATIGARGVASAIGLYILFFTAVGPTTRLEHLRPDLTFMKDIVRLGTPSMIENSANALAQITLIGIVVTFAPPVVAAYGLGNRIVSLVFLPAMGLGRAIDTMVGQNLGADRADRATRSVYLATSTAAGVMLLVAVVVVLLTEPIVSVFLGDVANAPETIALGVEYVQTRSVEFAFIGVTQVLLGAFRGAGNTKTAMIISIVTLWIGRVGTVSLLVFGLGWGASGVWIGMAVGNILGVVVSIPWFLRGTWKEAYIDETTTGESTGVVETASED
ncbi:MATE family efflux transporter [Halobacteriaceae bacterium SHR40]|uniref:MATE family efflux transporter n=1 Tax=Halovenus amylolytica TaxID=2500550 RepID=UPI000FE2EB4B